MNTSSQQEMSAAADLASKKASAALQKLISAETRLTVEDVRAIEKPQQSDAKNLAKRCIEYYKTSKTIVSSKVKLYKENGDKEDSGIILMFIDEADTHKLSQLLLSRLSAKKEGRPHKDMEDSAITEVLNIIGNAYIDVVAQHYQKTIMSMVPHVIDDMSFDHFIGELIAESENKIYILFNTNLVVTTQVINVPFLLAVALEEK